MIIAVVGLKGGIGKTTLSVHIAAELVRRKHEVLLIDADPQGSTQKWREKAENEDDWPALMAYSQPILHKKKQVRHFAKNYEFVVIDTPPYDDGMASSALMVADFALLPVTPSGLDLEELEKSIRLVENAMGINEELQAATFVSNKPSNTVIGRELRDILTEAPFDSIPLLESETTSRVQFREVTLLGELIHSYAPHSRATKEVKALVKEILEVTK